MCRDYTVGLYTFLFACTIIPEAYKISTSQFHMYIWELFDEQMQ